MEIRNKVWKNKIKERFQSLKHESIFLTIQTATSKTWTRTLDPGPWTRTLDPEKPGP